MTKRSSLASVARLAATAVTSILLGAAALPGIARAGAVQSISGTAKSNGGAAIPDTRVCAEAADTEEEGPEPEDCVLTSSVGSYRIELAKAGEYVVEFTGEVCAVGLTSCRRAYLPQFYDGAKSFEAATRLHIGIGEERSEIDATLEPSHRISGVVRAPDGAPLDRAEVCAEPYYSTHFKLEKCALTGADGRYALEGLEPITTRVAFTGYVCERSRRCEKDYAEQFWRGEADVNQATPVELLTETEATEVDATLEVGGSIAGTIESDSIYHEPIEQTEACGWSDDVLMACTITNASGSYELAHIPPGSYQVSFSGAICPPAGECTEVYNRVFYNSGSPTGVTEKSEATLVQVTAEQTVSGIDVELQESHPQLPQPTSSPTVAGSAVVGGSVECRGSGWRNRPTALTYVWYRNGDVVSGASSATLALGPTFANAGVYCVEVASNSAGKGEARSGEVRISAPAAPSAVSAGLASVAGRAVVHGQTASVRLSCALAGPCRGRLLLKLRERVRRRVRGGGRRRAREGTVLVTIGKAAFSLAARASAVLRVHLGTHAVKLLGKARGHRLRVGVAGRGVHAGSLTLVEGKGARRARRWARGR